MTVVTDYNKNMPNPNFKRTQKYYMIEQIWELYTSKFYTELDDAIKAMVYSHTSSYHMRKRLVSDIREYFKNVGEL